MGPLTIGILSGKLTYFALATPASDHYRQQTVDVAVQEPPARAITFALTREVRQAIADADRHAVRPEGVTRLNLLARGTRL